MFGPQAHGQLSSLHDQPALTSCNHPLPHSFQRKLKPRPWSITNSRPFSKTRVQDGSGAKWQFKHHWDKETRVREKLFVIRQRNNCCQFDDTNYKLNLCRLPFHCGTVIKRSPPDSRKVNFKARTSKWRAFARKITNTSRDGETFCLEEATRSISQMWICRDKIDWQVNTGTQAMCRRDLFFFFVWVGSKMSLNVSAHHPPSASFADTHPGQFTWGAAGATSAISPCNLSLGISKWCLLWKCYLGVFSNFSA